METTFITIHNTTPQANILYASASIIDILGFEAHQVVGLSVFDYFHAEDVADMREKHSAGIQQDKAAVITYARICNSRKEYVHCECIFTVVYDVLVACTSIYKRNTRNEKRLADSQAVQQQFHKFKSVPRDNRYHMLGYMSNKFVEPAAPSRRELRAALILNRFTRTLAILYATDSLAEVLGVTPEQIDGKSFYECMHEQCHPAAIRALESAKANDSIAYLKFYYRDPRRPDEREHSASPHSSDSDEEGGVVLNQTPMPGAYPGDDMDVEMGDYGTEIKQEDIKQEIKKEDEDDKNFFRPDLNNSRSNSDRSVAARGASMFGSDQSRSSTSSAPSSNAQRRTNGSRNSSPRNQQPDDAIMVEAVVSCSSDGMVVILRRANDEELTPQPEPEPAQNASVHAVQQPPQQRVRPQEPIFAAPWGAEPLVPGYQPERAIAISKDFEPHLQALEAHAAATNGPYNPQFMQTIRDVAVFAWAVAGINGNLARYANGTPEAPAVPPFGYPVWDPNAPGDSIEPPPNQALQKWTEFHARIRGGQQVPLPFMQQEHDPEQYHRQERLVRQQYEQPYGPDAPGSSARRHLGKYMGEDGRGPRMLQANHNWWLQGQDQKLHHNYQQPQQHHHQNRGQQSYPQQVYAQSQQSYSQPQQYGPPRPPQQEQGYGQQPHYSNPYGQAGPGAIQQQQQYSQHYHNGYEQAKPRPQPQQQGYGYSGGSSFDRAPPQSLPPMSTGIDGHSASGFRNIASYQVPVTADRSGSNGYGNGNAYGGASASDYASATYGNGNAPGSGGYGPVAPSAYVATPGSGSGSGGSANNSGGEGSASRSPDRYLWY